MSKPHCLRVGPPDQGHFRKYLNSAAPGILSEVHAVEQKSGGSGPELSARNYFKNPMNSSLRNLSWFHKMLGIVPSRIPSHPDSCGTCSTASERSLLRGGKGGRSGWRRGNCVTAWRGPRGPAQLSRGDLPKPSGLGTPATPSGGRETRLPSKPPSRDQPRGPSALRAPQTLAQLRGYSAGALPSLPVSPELPPVGGGPESPGLRAPSLLRPHSLSESLKPLLSLTLALLRRFMRSRCSS